MRTATRLRDGAAALALCVTAAVYVVGVLWLRPSAPGSDLASADYPIILYMLRALRAGHGLLWNRLQNCGEPFLASSLSGVLYPPRWLFVVLPFDVALLAITALHLMAAGLGAYALGRALGVTRVAALCGGLVFQLGGSAATTAHWLPLSMLGEYALIAVALWRAERLLRAPDARNAVALGVVLTLQLLPGYPLMNLFTYQLIAARTALECCRRGVPRVRVVGTTAFALAVPLALGAVQVLPMLEFGGVSIRNRALSMQEIAPFGLWTWTSFRARVGLRLVDGGGVPFTAAPIVLAGLGVPALVRRPVAAFYVLAGALYFVLALDTPLLRWSLALPFGTSFRFPQYGLAVTALGLAVLSATGADVLVRGRRWAPAAALAGALAYVVFMPVPLLAVEWITIGGLVIVAAVVVLRRRPVRRAGWAAGVVPALCAANLLYAGSIALFGVPHGVDALYARREVFAALAERMTPGDRMFTVSVPLDFSLIPKSASVFGVPSIVDYEPQTSARYAELLVRLFLGVPMTSINQFLYGLGRVPQSRPLLDLVATRWIAVPLDHAALPAIRGLPAVVERATVGDVVLLENTAALPRARYVPQVRVIADPSALLATLASADVDPRRTALIETAPADGFLGGSTAGSGRAEIVEDRDETVTVAVDADADGFLFLSDQDYPGWEATVDGHPTRILRADHAFRLVRVPAGRSTVRFRYRPWSVGAGAAISLATFVLLIGYGLAGRRRRGPVASDESRAAA